MSQSLSERLREHIKGRRSTEAEFSETVASPPATAAVVAEAESRLGFPLTSLLRDVYMTVGNGGFGPGYGLMGLPGGATELGYSIVEFYFELRKSYGAAWPEKLVPIATYGCNIYVLADCSKPHAPLTWWEGVPSDSAEDPIAWEKCFRSEADSLEEWLDAWLKRSSGERDSVNPSAEPPAAPAEAD